MLFLILYIFLTQQQDLIWKQNGRIPFQESES